jgi:hypothetical protein
MAPSNSTSSSATLRIPLRRFATHVLLSVLATLIPELFQKWDMLFIFPIVIPVFGVWTDLALVLLNPLDKTRSSLYSASLTMCLGYLHQATTVIGEGLLDSSSGFSQTQHIAVHICLAFFIISEFEFYRAYVGFRNFESGFDAIKYFLVANAESDHVFPISRDPWGFGYMNFTEGPDFEIFTKAFGLCFAQWFIFWIVNGLANVLLKCMVDPSWNEGKGLWLAMTSVNVLFTTKSIWQLFLNVPLLRVVRQSNHVAF